MRAVVLAVRLCCAAAFEKTSVSITTEENTAYIIIPRIGSYPGEEK